MKILLLGSTGQLGSDIFRELSKSDLFDIYAPKSTELNLYEKNFIDNIFNKKFDYVINCVAIHDINFSEKRASRPAAVERETDRLTRHPA